MRTFKRIPLPEHEYIIIVQYGDAKIIFKRHYSKLTDTVHYTIEAEPWVLRVFQDYIQDFWYAVEGDGIINTLRNMEFTEIEATELEFKMYVA